MSYEGLEWKHDGHLQLCCYSSICLLYPQGYGFLLRPDILAFCKVVPEVPGVKSPTAVTHKTEPQRKCTSASVSLQVPNTKVCTGKILNSSLIHPEH